MWGLISGSVTEVHATKTTGTTREIRLSKASSIQLNIMLQSGCYKRTRIVTKEQRLLQKMAEVGVFDSRHNGNPSSILGLDTMLQSGFYKRTRTVTKDSQSRGPRFPTYWYSSEAYLSRRFDASSGSLAVFRAVDFCCSWRHGRCCCIFPLTMPTPLLAVV